MKTTVRTLLRFVSSAGFLLCLTFFKFDARNAEAQNAPAASEAQQVLKNLIEEQSGGRIRFADIQMLPDMASSRGMELNGEKIYPFPFGGHVTVTGPCKWDSQHDGHPLTFNTFKADDANVSAGKSIFEISSAGDTFALRGVALFSSSEKGLKLAGFSNVMPPKRAADEACDRCVEQMKQIGLAVKIWAGDNNDKYPFQASTQLGGTKELCAVGSDGFDTHTAMHFQVLSNELSTTRILVCPADASKKPAISFSLLMPGNVSYLLRTGPDVDEAHPDAVLARCPIHGNILYCDGRVERGIEK